MSSIICLASWTNDKIFKNVLVVPSWKKRIVKYWKFAKKYWIQYLPILFFSWVVFNHFLPLQVLTLAFQYPSLYNVSPLICTNIVVSINKNFLYLYKFFFIVIGSHSYSLLFAFFQTPLALIFLLITSLFKGAYSPESKEKRGKFNNFFWLNE